MTELIQAIRAEIERQISAHDSVDHLEAQEVGKAWNRGHRRALEDLLSFISTLESEKPMSLDFEQELYKRFGMVKDFTLGMRIAQAFYDLGCCRTAERYDEIEYNRQRAEESPLPEDTVLFNKGVEEGRRLAEEEQADLFTIVALDAAQRAKEQMLKEAVEGEIVKDISNRLAVTAKNVNLNGFKFGDKVRIIIVKDNN